ncbi:unnamed protein product, partial [Mesorhabditis spiculigera]
MTCTLERLVATVFYKTYEKRRPWVLLLIPAITAPLFAYCLAADVFAAQMSLAYLFIEMFLKLFDVVIANSIEITGQYSSAKCLASPGFYPAAFGLYLVFRQALILLTPLLIFRLSRPLRKRLIKLTRHILRKTSKIASVGNYRLEYRNPLGKKIKLNESKELYFTHLKTMWR